MTQATPSPDRQYMEAQLRLFQKYILEDQRNYYKRAVSKYRRAAEQVNRWRAIFALITGLSAALAGLLVSTSLNGTICPLNFGTLSTDAQNAALANAEEVSATGIDTLGDARASAASYCPALQYFVFFLVVLTILAPAIGAGFTTLADLYQWDRMVTVYDSALENLEVADAQSPVNDMNDLVYKASLRAYAEGTLSVMRDETAQWGQLIKTPAQLEEFIKEELAKAEEANGVADLQVRNREMPAPIPPREPLVIPTFTPPPEPAAPARSPLVEAEANAAAASTAAPLPPEAPLVVNVPAAPSVPDVLPPDTGTTDDSGAAG